MLVGDPTLPEITVSLTQFLYAIGISMNVVGAVLLIKEIRRRRSEKKKTRE